VSDGVFRISKCSGLIKVDLAQLDYETKNQYTLKVRVTDDGRPQPLWVETIVTIRVLNRNENPVFASPTLAVEAKENCNNNDPALVPSTSNQALVTATDPDIGDTLT